jgi:hypothetical protein
MLISSHRERTNMRANLICSAAALAAIGLAGCTAGEPSSDATNAAQAIVADPLPPFRAAIPTAALMRAIEMTAEIYWESTSIVVDIEGEHENYPQTDEEWMHVWAAGIMLAEAGNVLMMPSHALDQGEWMQMSETMVEAGLGAARAADARDFMAVLDEGEKVYNACVACHEKYVPSVGL